jgi:hypothetical protein
MRQYSAWLRDNGPLGAALEGEKMSESGNDKMVGVPFSTRTNRTVPNCGSPVLVMLTGTT